MQQFFQSKPSRNKLNSLGTNASTYQSTSFEGTFVAIGRAVHILREGNPNFALAFLPHR